MKTKKPIKCFCGFAYDGRKFGECPQSFSHKREAFLKRFTIYTEDKDAKWIENLLSIGFDGFTVIKAAGYFEGIKEKSLEIVIYTSNTMLIRAMAERIKHHNKQKAVLITEENCKVVTI